MQIIELIIIKSLIKKLESNRFLLKLIKLAKMGQKTTLFLRKILKVREPLASLFARNSSKTHMEVEVVSTREVASLTCWSTWALCGLRSQTLSARSCIALFGESFCSFSSDSSSSVSCSSERHNCSLPNSRSVQEIISWYVR